MARARPLVTLWQVLASWRRLPPQAQDAIAALAILVAWLLVTSQLRANRLMLPNEPESWVFAAWASAAAVASRRAAPLAALVAFAVVYPAVYMWDLQSEFHLLPVLVVGYTAVSLGRAPAWLVGPVGMASVATLYDLTPDYLGARVDWSRVMFGMFVVAGTVFLGAVTREQRATASLLAARNAELERLREIEARQVVAQERSRIARELHDVVAHHISAIVIRAQAADRVADAQPHVPGESVRWIAGAGKEALTAMRQTVRMLRQRDGGDGPELAPQGTVADIPAIAARVTGAGLPVEVRLPAALPAVDPHVDLAAVRIAQEALTNALRHAGARRACVTLAEVDGGLVVEVDDDGASGRRPPPRPEGHGLVGMAERAASCGGRFGIMPSPLGGWRVRAWLPLAPMQERAWAPSAS
jgi:signal transduction histidine kinase